MSPVPIEDLVADYDDEPDPDPVVDTGGASASAAAASAESPASASGMARARVLRGSRSSAQHRPVRGAVPPTDQQLAYVCALCEALHSDADVEVALLRTVQQASETIDKLKKRLGWSDVRR